MEAEIVILNELKEPEARERRALANRLKPIIAAPPDYLPVNRKGMHPFNVANRCFVMAFSNFRDAIALPSDDGRWFVLWSNCDRMTPAEALPIWNWYLTGGGREAVAAWLMARDVSKFNPAASAPWTEAKGLLCEQSLSAAEAYLVDCVCNGPEFRSGVIGGPWHQLLDQLQGRAPSGIKLYPAALYHALGEAGWSDVGRVMSLEHQTKRRVFVRQDNIHMSKSDLRRIIEEPMPGLKLVK